MKQAVELLGFGSYYNVEGLHPSGVPYTWDRHPCEVGPDCARRVTARQMDALFAGINDYLDMMGYKRTSQSNAGASAGTRKSIDDPSQWAPSPQHVLDLLKAWRNTPENVPTHEDFVCATAAIKTAFGPDREEYYPDFLEWAMEYAGNDEAYVRGRWDSIR